MAKRYLLYMADADLRRPDLVELARILETRHGKLRLIEVRDSGRAVIVKTDQKVVAEIRERSGRISVGGKELVAVLTSGAIGKLKRTATGSGTTENGEVPQ